MFLKVLMLISQVHLKNVLSCHYWYSFDKGFRFQSSVCKGCHDALMLSIDINSIVIRNNHGVDYRCIIVGIRKIEVINLLKNANLSEKNRSL